MIGYQIFGPADAPPVLYCHGWPSSRLEAGLLADPPVRLIAADRPGYGLSSPHPETTLLDQARDSVALADHLGLDRFAVAGVSGGGPQAAALAHLLPGRVAALGLISAVPPAGPAVMASGDLRLLLRLAGMGPLAAPLMVAARQIMWSPVAQTLVFNDKLAPADRAVLPPAMRAALIEVFREGLRLSSLGALADARIYARPWGFQLASITVPTLAWHGGADHLIPAAAARIFSTIPGVVLDIRPNEGHYSLALGHGRELLSALIAASGITASTTGAPRNPG